MAQRNSGYVRQARDAYMTPHWVTEILIADLEREGILPVVKRDAGYPNKRYPLAIWEPAAGTGQMADALARGGYEVFCTDIQPEPGIGSAHDFTKRELPLLMPEIGAIITNPPYKKKEAEAFVRNALDIMASRQGVVAMLLAVDWDSGKTRRKFFADCPAWRRKIVLLDRIHWFDPEPVAKGEKKKAGPSANHAWYVWSFAPPLAKPTIGYACAPASVKAHLKACRQRVAA